MSRRQLMHRLALALFVTTTTVSSAASGDAPGQSAPVNTSPPSVQGTARQGEQLTADQGAWSGPSADFAVLWHRCDASGAPCATISGATSAAYTTIAADVGSVLRVVVIATNKNGSTVATSDPTAAIAGSAPTPNPPAPVPEAPRAACTDSADNDGDGKVDFPADPGCTSSADTDEADPTVAPPPSEWVMVAKENESFVLDANREVRYGRNATWTSKILGAGTYSCSNAFFGDPLVGVVKVCEARSTTQEPTSPPPPPPSEWVKVANEHESFTLSANREVRYGRNATWTSKVLGPGTYSCSNAFFGDPLVGLAKICEARPTTLQPLALPPPPLPSSLFFNGDFNTGDLSQWNDFHDAHLSRTPPGIQVVSSPSVSGAAAKVNVIQAPDTSQWGDATYLWEGSGSNAYSLPYLQNGRTTWFRFQVAFPDGTNPAFPGKFTPASGAISLIEEWHTNPGIVPNAYSSFIGLDHSGGPGGRPSLIFQTRGGAGEGEMHRYYQTDGAQQTAANRQALKYNHWYDIVTRITFGPTAQTGSIEWYVDGVAQTPANVPTIAVAANGSVPGLGHQIGHYRGPSHPGLDVIYIDGLMVGPTRSSLG
jgi:Polysaccharide lyase